jgi:hypothetical protein
MHGFLMPARKDQAPPDLRYFKQSQNDEEVLAPSSR